jgi:flavin-dependent dehydrogenase
LRKTKVLIVGAGPAGAATVLSLSKRGIESILVERSPAVFFKAGEAIAPNAQPVFHKLGVEALLRDPKHQACYGNRFVWGSTEPLDKDFLQNTYTIGHHIDRMHLEQQLLTEVKKTGTTLLQGWSVVNCKKTSGDWTVLLQDGNGKQEEISCEFVVDATGRPSRVAGAIGIRRIRSDNLMGISACFSLSEFQSPHYTFIEAVQDGWWYAAPISGNRIATAYMTDADLLDPQMLKTDSYLQSLHSTILMPALLSGVIEPKNTHLTTCTASTSYLERRYGDGWLAVGDAACSFDPISSYGITSALEGGYYAGHAIADTFQGFNEALPAYDWLLTTAFAVYKEMHRHQYQLEQRWPEEPFWARRTKEFVTAA